MNIAGAGAMKLLELLPPSGLHLEHLSEVAVAKGMASVITDSLWAAESMGLQNWAHEEILEQFASHTAETAKQYLSGTAQHVKRRQIEMMC
ncbi:hypothetical protein EU811_22630 [Arthrobacter sp. TS-15]|uniref:hypothetical protein n=1 Tax=Arthrobacter sp. TS-15 TaxID=2510797 RepID=UPI00115E0A32|nr:hypothetical protein [Arthrobacter sp. TS-15]TQS87375.1 hypothetical protein EU811_22630 [Arthrobacter sp. TS-15]